jgi:hypothetical protein
LRAHRLHTSLLGILVPLVLGGCTHTAAPAAPPALIGAWRAKVQFSSGSFATIQDLEFMYVFNSGGTMTESSNYDGVPPVPPAYGEWIATGAGAFEAKYTFFTTRPPADLKSLPTGGGWLPAGSGMLIEKIQLTAGGQSYDSSIHLELFDTAGKPVAGGGEARAHATRAGF